MWWDGQTRTVLPWVEWVSLWSEGHTRFETRTYTSMLDQHELRDFSHLKFLSAFVNDEIFPTAVLHTNDITASKKSESSTLSALHPQKQHEDCLSVLVLPYPGVPRPRAAVGRDCSAWRYIYLIVLSMQVKVETLKINWIYCKWAMTILTIIYVRKIQFPWGPKRGAEKNKHFLFQIRTAMRHWKYDKLFSFFSYTHTISRSCHRFRVW